MNSKDGKPYWIFYLIGIIVIVVLYILGGKPSFSLQLGPLPFSISVDFPDNDSKDSTSETNSSSTQSGVEHKSTTKTSTPTPISIPKEEVVEPSNVQDNTVEVHRIEVIEVIDQIQAPISDFMFPYSSIYELTDEQLASMEDNDPDRMHSKSQMAINEIYARYGYTFALDDNPSNSAIEAKNYFESKDWYRNAQLKCPIQNQDALRDMMNPVEQKNIELINNWQKMQHIYY